jgi:hypothetical protein
MTRRRLAVVHGLYYLASGLWPLLSLRSFERVTGPKTDDWLVRTVGMLAAAVGSVLLIRSRGGQPSPDPALGIASASAFAVTDVVHVARGTISPVYLADAIVELALVAAWVSAAPERGAGSARPR